MGRRQSSGSLGIQDQGNCRRWRGQWSVVVEQPNGGFKRIQKTKYFGTVKKVSREEAEAALRRAVEQSRKGADLNSKKTFRVQSAIPPLARGAVAELLVCSDLLSKGWEVFKNVNPTGTIDIVGKPAGSLEFQRIQVKCGVLNEDRPVVNLGRQLDEMDMLALVLADGAIRYFDRWLKPIQSRPQTDQGANQLQEENVSC